MDLVRLRRKVMLDMALHGLGLAEDEVGQLRVVGRGGIGQDGQRSLQRMGQIARVHPRLFSLFLAMGEQAVDFLHQRFDLQRQRLGNAVRPFGAHGLDCRTHAAQRRKAVIALQRGHDEEA